MPLGNLSVQCINVSNNFPFATNYLRFTIPFTDDYNGGSATYMIPRYYPNGHITAAQTTSALSPALQQGYWIDPDFNCWYAVNINYREIEITIPNTSPNPHKLGSVSIEVTPLFYPNGNLYATKP